MCPFYGDQSTSSPSISQVAYSAKDGVPTVTWITDSQTTGSVLYQVDGEPIATMASNVSGVSHKVYFPSIEPGTTHEYWVIAKDSQGHTSASAKQTITAPSGIRITNTEAVVISGTSVEIKWESSTQLADLKWYVQCAEVGPSITNLAWKQVYAGTGAANVALLSSGLDPNREYTYRVRAVNPDSTIAASSPFGTFVTKTSSSNVRITSINDGEVVSGSIDIAVEAWDSVARFTDNGILSAELEVDGEVVGALSRTPGTNEYHYYLNTAGLTPGFHKLTAKVRDDYWRRTVHSINVVVFTGAESPQSDNSTSSTALGAVVLGGKKRQYLRRHFGVNDPTKLPSAEKLALIVVGENGWFTAPMLNLCANTERKRYAAKGYKVVIMYSDEVGGLANTLAKGMYSQSHLKAFTYLGHGSAGVEGETEATSTKGALAYGPSTTMTSGDLAVGLFLELLHYKKKPENVCPARLDYMRLFSCWSGLAQYNSSNSLVGLPAKHTFVQSFKINPPTQQWMHSKVKPPKKTWTSPNAVRSYPCLITPLD